MKCLARAVLSVLLVAFSTSICFAQVLPTGAAQRDLRYVTTQFQEIATTYLPGTMYEKTMEDLVRRAEAMTEDESRILAPLLPGMLANLEIFKGALASLNEPRIVPYATMAAGAGFPEASYPNFQLMNYPALALPALMDVVRLPLAYLDAVAHGGTISQEWTSSWVNAAPMTCVTMFDQNGDPVRTPDFTMQTLRVAVQVAEATKEGANCVLEQVLTGAGFGANAKWLTIVPTGIWLVEKAIYENLNACDAMISGAETGAAYRRLGHIHDDLEVLGSKAASAEGDLSSIKSSLAVIEQKLDEAITLLKTAPGLRQDFPNNKNKK